MDIKYLHSHDEMLERETKTETVAETEIGGGEGQSDAECEKNEGGCNAFLSPAA